MAEDVTAIYRLKFKDLASKGLLRVQKIAKGMAKAFKGAANVIGGFISGFAAGLKEQLPEIAEMLAQQEAMARAVGVSASSLRTLGDVAAGIGGDFESLVDLQEELNNKVGEFKFLGELTSLEEGLGALGLKAKEFVKLKPAQQMEALVKASAKVDQQIASSAADMILGGEASKIFGALNREVKESGLTVEEYFNRQKKLNFLTDAATKGALAYQKSMKGMKRSAQSLVSEVGGRLSGSIAVLVDGLKEFLIANSGIIKQKIDVYAAKIAKSIKEIDFDVIKAKALQFKDAIKETATKAKDLIIKFGGLKTIAKVLLGVFVVGKIAAFSSSLLALGTTFGVVGGIIVKFLKLATLNPLGLAITAVVVAGVALWKNWDKIKEVAKVTVLVISQKWNELKEGFSNVVGDMKAGAAVISSLVFGKMKSGVESLKNTFAATWDLIKAGVAASVKFITDKIDLVIKQYNKLATSAVGARLGLERVDLLSERAASTPAAARAASTPYQYGREAVDVNVEISGRVDGMDGQANVTTSSRRGRRGSNLPGGRHAAAF